MTTGAAARTPEVTWVKCSSCDHLVYGKRLARNLYVCPECGAHRRLTAPQRIAQLVDPDSFVPLRLSSEVNDVLTFTDTKPYLQRLGQARRSTGLGEAVVCGLGRINGHALVLAVMDFRFMGGSLGSAVGDLITKAAAVALERELPLLIVTSSGGARMQEGALSLMQMAKTSAALAALNDAGLMNISLITDPTYGGVAASFATNTDVLVAEAGARLGFAGPRVIEQTIRQELPDGFQTAEFLLERGQVDIVEERRNLRGVLGRLLAAAHGRELRTLPEAEPVLVRDPEQFAGRDAWDVVQLARNADRPTTSEYLTGAFETFLELHGDRLFADNPSIIAGIAQLGGLPVAVVGHQKGHTTKELVAHNFGMPQPEGYRKALRVMKLAEKLGLPVVSLVDTPGAYPGQDAEERGQAVAIAQNILQMSSLRTPVVTVVTGEGGSGGALALAVADRVLVMQNSIYSVISPEGCAAILWNSPAAAPDAARALGITPPDLLRHGIADGVVPEPEGGAHCDPKATVAAVRAALLETLPELLAQPADELITSRRSRYRNFGATDPMRRVAERDDGDTEAADEPPEEVVNEVVDEAADSEPVG